MSRTASEQKSLRFAPTQGRLAASLSAPGDRCGPPASTKNIWASSLAGPSRGPWHMGLVGQRARNVAGGREMNVPAPPATAASRPKRPCATIHRHRGLDFCIGGHTIRGGARARSQAAVNIVDPVLFQCRQSPATPAICAPGTMLNVVSYGRLERFIHNIGRRALAHGLKRGDVVAVFMADPIFHAALVLGLTALGIVTLTGRSVQLPKDFAVDAVISDGLQRFAPGHRVINADASWLAGDGVPVAPTPTGTPDDPCRIVLTSGTTGDAKGILLTHRMVHQRLALHQYAFGAVLPACTRIFCDLGLTTSLGFHVPDARASSRRHLVPARDRCRRNHAGVRPLSGPGHGRIAGRPRGISRLLRADAKRLLVVRRHRERRQSVEPRAGAAPARAAVLQSGFGLWIDGSEYRGAAPASVVAVTEGAVGHPLPGVFVEAAGANDEALPAGQQGLLRIRTENAATGYHGARASPPFGTAGSIPATLAPSCPMACWSSGAAHGDPQSGWGEDQP